jgi:hypothetical protein
VLILSNVTAWHIGQRRVCVDDPRVYQLLQWNQMLFKACIFDPAATESQGRVIIFDVCEERLCLRVSERSGLGVEIFHVVTAINVLDNVTPIWFKVRILTYFPVEPKVSIAYSSPSSIFTVEPPFTMGTLLPACI